VRSPSRILLLTPALVTQGLPLVACGGAPAAAPVHEIALPRVEANVTPAPSAAGSGREPTSNVPTQCADKASDLCIPPPAFTNRLCAKPHQDLALTLLGKGSPFTRLYLRARVDELAFDEEVLAVRFHAQPKGGMVVGSGNGTYDVLRWDGSCSTGVEAEVFTRARPPRPRAAHVQWHRIGDRTQNSLVGSSEAVKRAHARRGKECKGAMSGDVSAACEKADAALVDAVVDYARTTGSLPTPDPP
jgi:hypothetical protein